MFSVIIPSFNSQKTIVSCLNCLQTAAGAHDMEIIVVDSSKDATPDLIANSYPDVHMVHYDGVLAPGKARNIGLNHAGGDYICFVDSDCLVCADYFDKILELFHVHQDWDGLGGAYRNGTPYNIWGTVNYYLEFYHWLPHARMRLKTSDLVGGGMVYKAQLCKSIKFEEGFEKGQDVFCSALLARQEKQLAFVPELSVTHINKTSFKDFIKSQYACGYGSAWIRLKGYGSHRWVLNAPLLAWFFPCVMIPKMFFGSLLRQDWVYVLWFILGLPLFLLGNCFWAAGFYIKACEHHKEKHPLL